MEKMVSPYENLSSFAENPRFQTGDECAGDVIEGRCGSGFLLRRIPPKRTSEKLRASARRASLEMYIAEKKEGFCKIGLAYRKELTNPHGNIHGGAIASLIDTAAVQGLRTIFSKGPYLTVDVKFAIKTQVKQKKFLPKPGQDILRVNFSPPKSKFWIKRIS